MRRRNKLITTILTMVMVLPFFLGLGSAKDVMAATGKQVVTLHKVKVTNMPDEENFTPNTGDIMENFGEGALAGAVFTAYDVSATYWAAYDQADGGDANKSSIAESAAKAATTWTGEPIVFPATGSNGAATVEGGLSTKSNVNGKMRNAIYLFKETASPAGVVQGASVPFILGLPVYDEGTDTEKTVVHIYPKNEYKELNLGFTKYGVDEKGNSSVLEGAQFVLKEKGEDGLYYNSTSGKFDSAAASATKLYSDEVGKVLVEGLVLNPGTYEFYEENSVKSTMIYQGDVSDESEKHHYKKNPLVTAVVNDEMEVTYEYFDIYGVPQKLEVDDDELAEAYNYKVPRPTKKVNEKNAAEVKHVDLDEQITFTITQKIPLDIVDYTKFVLVDTFNPNLGLVSENETALLKEIKSGMGALAKLATGVQITDSGFTISFDLEEVKKHAGETITFTVKMAVKNSETLKESLATDLENNIEFENNFADKSAKDSVKTYGKSFVKVDGDTRNPIAGAEFIVLHPDSDKGVLGTKNGKQVWGREGDEDFEVTVIKTNDDGEFSIYGLAQKGEINQYLYYELKEIKAPEGYTLPTRTFKFVADNGKSVLKINNKHKGSLPSTGGSGIVAFVLIGIVAVGGAVLYFTKGRRQIEG